MHNDNEISKAIVTLLESNVGYGIEFFGGILSLYQLEDLTYVVGYKKYNSETQELDFDFEQIFTDAKEATSFFLQKRREYELGFDFEIEDLSKNS